MRKFKDLHRTGDHAQVHHYPAEREANPVLPEVQSQAVGQETTGHTTYWNPDTVQAVFRHPTVFMGAEDPFVENVTNRKTWGSQWCVVDLVRR